MAGRYMEAGDDDQRSWQPFADEGHLGLGRAASIDQSTCPSRSLAARCARHFPFLHLCAPVCEVSTWVVQ